MKKTALILGVALAFFSCSKSIETVSPTQDETSDLILNFSISDGTEPETRGVKKDWVNNDRLYLFFDKEILPQPEYLTVKYDRNGTMTGTAKTWYAESWSPGLKAKISSRSSGTVSILYVPNDKVGGRVNVSYKESDGRYSLRPVDRVGDDFCSYSLEAANVAYTVKNGVITLTATMSLPPRRHFQQYCIEKGADGKTIPDSDAHYYHLKIEDSTGNHFVNSFAMYGYDSSGNFLCGQMLKGMSAYYYGGLCFSGEPYGFSGKVYTVTFTLTDSKNNKTYTYTVDTSLNKKAYKLPALSQWTVQ